MYGMWSQFFLCGYDATYVNCKYLLHMANFCIKSLNAKEPGLFGQLNTRGKK